MHASGRPKEADQNIKKVHKIILYDRKVKLNEIAETGTHKSIKTMATLHESGYELLSHPPYSPDLALSDFFVL
jgi:hypothetical protein